MRHAPNFFVFEKKFYYTRTSGKGKHKKFNNKDHFSPAAR
jgi:hypothetical protein